MPKVVNQNAKSGNGNGNGKSQSFTLAAPKATKVQLAGDFTQWQEKPINMNKGQDGIWRAAVELSPGTHRYRFLVDGQWQDDPNCALREANPYGSHDAVRKI